MSGEERKMTVRELMKLLEEYDPSAVVYLAANSEGQGLRRLADASADGPAGDEEGFLADVPDEMPAVILHPAEDEPEEAAYDPPGRYRPQAG
jgi:hypothetical protein